MKIIYVHRGVETNKRDARTTEWSSDYCVFIKGKYNWRGPL